MSILVMSSCIQIKENTFIVTMAWLFIVSCSGETEFSFRISNSFFLEENQLQSPKYGMKFYDYVGKG